MVEEKEGKRGKQTHGLLILGGTGESTRRPGPSDEQHSLGVVGAPIVQHTICISATHTHRHNDQYVQYVLQYQAKRAAHCGTNIDTCGCFWPLLPTRSNFYGSKWLVQVSSI